MNFLEKKREVLSNLVRKGTEDTGGSHGFSHLGPSQAWEVPPSAACMDCNSLFSSNFCQGRGCRSPFSVNRGVF